MTLFVNRKIRTALHLLNTFRMNSLSKVFLFIFFVSGLLFGFRTIIQLLHERLLDRYTLTKIGTLLVLLVVIASAIFSAREMVVIISLILGGFVALAPIVAKRRERLFQRACLAAIEETLLAMKSGHGFRQSIEEAIRRCDSFTQQKLLEIMQLVAFSPQNCPPQASPFALFLAEELRQVDLKPHRAIQRLEVLRERFKFEQNLRRRSGEAIKQVQMQAVVLSFLYVALLVALSFQVPLYKYKNLIGVSVFMMFLGFAVMVWLLRRFKWRI